MQLLRDRLTFGMIVGIPALQLMLFGYAINTDVRHLQAAVADQANTRMSRQLVAAVEASQVADVVATVHTAAELEVLLREGRISIGILIPPDFERRLQIADRPTAQLLVDATDPVLLGTARASWGWTFAIRCASRRLPRRHRPSRSAPTTTRSGVPRYRLSQA